MTFDEHIAQLTAPTLVERLRAESTLIGWKDSTDDEDRTLIAALDTPEPERRWRIAYVLGDRWTEQSLPALYRLADDPVWDVRAAVAYALGGFAESDMTDAHTFEVCQRMAFNITPDEQTTYVAALGLLNLDHARALDVLTAALDAEDEKTRRIAHSALAVDRWRAQAS